MITLKDFLKIIHPNHYRVYNPNRDCLIFESFFKIHSPYSFDKEHIYSPQKEYWEGNKYCDEVLKIPEENALNYDEGTKNFVELFGDSEVFSVEISGFSPTNITQNNAGSFDIQYLTGQYLQDDRGYIGCLNIFII